GTAGLDAGEFVVRRNALTTVSGFHRLLLCACCAAQDRGAGPFRLAALMSLCKNRFHKLSTGSYFATGTGAEGSAHAELAQDAPVRGAGGAGAARGDRRRRTDRFLLAGRPVPCSARRVHPRLLPAVERFRRGRDRR